MRIEPLLTPLARPSTSPLANCAPAVGSQDVATMADGYAGATAIRSPFAPPLARGSEHAPAPVLTSTDGAAQVGAEVQRNVAGRLLGVAGLALVSLGALAGCSDALPPPQPPATSQTMPSPITHPHQASVAQAQVDPGSDEWNGAPPPGGYYSESPGTRTTPQTQGGNQGRTTQQAPAQNDDDSGVPPAGGYYSDPNGGGYVWGPNQGNADRYVPPQGNMNPGYIPGQAPVAPTRPVTPKVVVPQHDPIAPPTSPMVPPTTVPPRHVPNPAAPVNPGGAVDAGDLQQRPNESFNDFMQRMIEAKQNALRQAQQNRPTTPTDPGKPNQSKTSVTVTAHGYWEGNDYHGVKEIRIWEVNNYQNRTYNTYTSYGTPASQSLSLNTAQPGKTCRVQVTWEGGQSRTYDVPADASGNPTSFDAWKY